MEFFGSIPFWTVLDPRRSGRRSYRIRLTKDGAWDAGKGAAAYEIRVVAPDGTTAGPRVEGDLWVLDRRSLGLLGSIQFPVAPMVGSTRGTGVYRQRRVGYLPLRANDTEVIGGVEKR